MVGQRPPSPVVVSGPFAALAQCPPARQAGLLQGKAGGAASPSWGACPPTPPCELKQEQSEGLAVAVGQSCGPEANLSPSELGSGLPKATLPRGFR